MAKNQKLKQQLKAKKNNSKKNDSKKDKMKSANKVSKISNKKQNTKKDKTVKKKEVKTRTFKVTSPLKEKVKKVLKTNEKPKKVQKIKKSENSISSSDERKLKELEESFDKCTIVELKMILKKNNQVCTGTKTDLVQRCTQGKLWGALPNCSKCFGGKLRYNIKTGEYYCPGYMNDIDFVFCSFRATDGLTRNPWQD
jgi:hypothetical protein